MKRFLAFLLCVLCLLPSFSLAFEMTADSAVDTGVLYPSPVTNFHEFWDIPWGASVEEVLQTAQDLYGISFVLQLEDSYGTSYITSSDASIYWQGHPVTLLAFFSGEVGGEKHLEEMSLYFQDIQFAVSPVSAWIEAGNVFTNLFSEYGPPWNAQLWCRCSTVTHSYELPLMDSQINIPFVIETAGDSISINANFDNILYFYDAYSSPNRSRYCHIAFYSPNLKNYSTYLPQATVLPFEEYANIPNHISPVDSSAITPTPITPNAPLRIDIGL